MANLLRFDFNDRDGIFEMVENGDWVRATDYDALAAKLAEVTDDCDDLQIALASTRKQLERYIGEAEAERVAANDLRKRKRTFAKLRGAIKHDARTTLAELKGEKDDQN